MGYQCINSAHTDKFWEFARAPAVTGRLSLISVYRLGLFSMAASAVTDTFHSQPAREPSKMMKSGVKNNLVHFAALPQGLSRWLPRSPIWIDLSCLNLEIQYFFFLTWAVVIWGASLEIRIQKQAVMNPKADCHESKSRLSCLKYTNSQLHQFRKYMSCPVRRFSFGWTFIRKFMGFLVFY